MTTFVNNPNNNKEDGSSNGDGIVVGVVIAVLVLILFFVIFILARPYVLENISSGDPNDELNPTINVDITNPPVINSSTTINY